MGFHPKRDPFTEKNEFLQEHDNVVLIKAGALNRR